MTKLPNQQPGMMGGEFTAVLRQFWRKAVQPFGNNGTSRKSRSRLRRSGFESLESRTLLSAVPFFGTTEIDSVDHVLDVRKIVAADLNKDGMVSAEEMVAFGEQMRAERKLLRAKEMIARFDTNKDGQLSLDEMPASKEPGKMFSRIDTDGDGAISKAEADEMKAKIANRMDKNRDGKGKYHDKGHGGFWFWGDDEGDN